MMMTTPSKEVTIEFTMKIVHVERDSDDVLTLYAEEEKGNQYYLTVDQEIVDALSSL